MKFRKKPVIIDAEQWFPGSNIDGVIEGDGEQHLTMGLVLGVKEHKSWPIGKIGIIETLEGNHMVLPGDWIITGVKGEKYPCKPDIFELTYEPA